jgi:hypothetical protein
VDLQLLRPIRSRRLPGGFQSEAAVQMAAYPRFRISARGRFQAPFEDSRLNIKTS